MKQRQSVPPFPIFFNETNFSERRANLNPNTSPPRPRFFTDLWFANFQSPFTLRLVSPIPLAQPSLPPSSRFSSRHAQLFTSTTNKAYRNRNIFPSFHISPPSNPSLPPSTSHVFPAINSRSLARRFESSTRPLIHLSTLRAREPFHPSLLAEKTQKLAPILAIKWMKSEIWWCNSSRKFA